MHHKRLGTTELMVWTASSRAVMAWGQWFSTFFCRDTL